LAGHFGAFIWRVSIVTETSKLQKQRKDKEKEERKE
jgi:hypothetical protein